MSKKKLSLDAIEVKSFITAMDVKKGQTVKGGGITPDPIGAPDDTLDYDCTQEPTGNNNPACGTIFRHCHYPF
ncbi:MAG: pinensin family lanthipeptide [Bacteroidota bacterium]